MPTFGFGPEVVTSATRPAAPAIGQLIYQTDTDEYLKYVTDSDGTVRWMQVDHGSNRSLVINGGFDVWQRGTSFAMNPASPYYTVDRWQTYRSGLALGGTFSRQASDLAGFSYFARMQRDSGNTNVVEISMNTSFETTNIKRIQGKYVTLSFWARRGATLSSANYNMLANIFAGTGTGGSIGNGFTGQVAIASTNIALTTTWKRYTITTSTTLLTTQNQLGVSLTFTPIGTAGATDYVDVVGVQLEAGTAPSDFEFRDFGDELRRCQRYYQRITSSGDWNQFGAGAIVGATEAFVHIPLLTAMRTISSATLSNLSQMSLYPQSKTPTSYVTRAVSTFGALSMSIVASAGGMTSGQGTTLISNPSTTPYIEVNGEL